MNKIKKIATLTLPLHHNYGGLIQAYALQKFITMNGYDTELINIDGHSLKPFLVSMAYRAKSLVLNRKKIDRDEITGFAKKNIKLTKKLKSLSDWKRADISEFDAYIVGSDQVWRADYAKNIECFYFSEINHSGKIFISYAASLGFDEIRYDRNSLDACSKLIKSFKAVSLRESDAVEGFCEQMGVQAQPVLDPTMLLRKEDYEGLIESNSDFCKNKIFAYILDINDEKLDAINYVEEKLKDNAHIFNHEGGKRSMSDWLSGFKNSSFVITDSFHGVVFSIIYRKQFVAIGNAERGLSRFTSLLTKFDLIDRLIIDSKKLNAIELLNIDYSIVERKLNKEVSLSKGFLLSNLESNNEK
ncbi:polysaccharide pyruvyl transferase family protein [Vibrio vulnificus]|nr:polysaccharide pyruvyl transferase family protein [Vibrio vulnificus]